MSATKEEWAKVFRDSSHDQLVGLVQHLAECESGLARQLEASLQKNKELEAEVIHLEGRLFGFSS